MNGRQIAMAIDVRGTLEGMAARLLAEAGAPAAVLVVLKACLQEGRDRIKAAGAQGERVDTLRWAAMNGRLHRTLADAAGNRCCARRWTTWPRRRWPAPAR